MCYHPAEAPLPPSDSSSNNNSSTAAAASDDVVSSAGEEAWLEEMAEARELALEVVAEMQLTAEQIKVRGTIWWGMGGGMLEDMYRGIICKDAGGCFQVYRGSDRDHVCQLVQKTLHDSAPGLSCQPAGIPCRLSRIRFDECSGLF